MTAPPCIRWGSGPDRCVRQYDHLGPCKDATGATTLTLTADILAPTKRAAKPEEASK